MLLIRTGGGSKTGFGHLTRMLRLVSQLKAETEYIFCIDRDKNVLKYMQEGRFPFCTPKNLSAEVLDKVKGAIFDMREIGGSEQSLINKLKKRNIKILQITDLGLSLIPEADIVIDSSVKQLHEYQNIPHLYKGPDYAILHHRYRHFHKVKRKYKGKGRNVLISLGGGAEYKDIRLLVDLLTRHNYKVKVAPGFCLKKSGRKTLKRIYPEIRFVGNPDSLARPFFEADIALISPGVAAYEAAACGTPALYVTHNSEQDFIATFFEEHGAGFHCGNLKESPEEVVLKNIKKIDFRTREDIGQKGKELVDALGLHRIIKLIKEHRLL